MGCYRFEERLFNDGIFSPKKAIDATYIIHLEGNGRLSQINRELDIIHPTNRVWILHNKGYKRCPKTQTIQTPAPDLIDCYIQIFQHSKEHNYSNILVLEDDFFWDVELKKKEHIDSISQFINSNTDFIYLLGCLPVLQVPINISGEHRTGISIGTHAVIYSKKCQDRVLKQEQSYIGDWDFFHNFNSRRYMYYRPLCYQLFPITDSQTKWLSNILPAFLQIFLVLYISIPILRGIGLDKSVDPGYTLFYQGSFYLSILCIIWVFWISYKWISYKYYKKIR